MSGQYDIDETTRQPVRPPLRVAKKPAPSHSSGGRGNPGGTGVAGTRRRPSEGFLIIAILLSWAALGLGSAALWPIYQTPRFVVLVIVAVLLGTLIAAVGAWFRWPSWALVISGFLAFLGSGVPLAVPDQAIDGYLPSLGGLQDLLSGVALGWKQLLTITLPVGTYQSLLVPALVLVLAATIVGISISLRARWGELGAIPPVILFVAGIVFGPDRSDNPVWLALALLIVTLITLVWRRWRRRRSPFVRSLERHPTPTAGP